MSKKSAKYRKFDGKIYTLWKTCSSKSEAISTRDFQKRMGNLSRIVKLAKRYAVYRRTE